MNKEHSQIFFICHPLAAVALLSISPLVTATTSHLCNGSTISCEIPASTFVSGSGNSSKTLSGNADTDILIVDSGRTVHVPLQTYYNFGLIKNHGVLNSGDGNTYPWLRIMGPGAMLDNYGVTNNLTELYVQNNSVLETNAPEGIGRIYNRSGGIFNNGSSRKYDSGEYFYGGISLYDNAEIINDGAFNNYSFLFVDGISAFTNNGMFTNYAPASTFAGGGGSDVLLQGTVTNTGTMHNVAGAAIETGNFHNTSTGKFINEGKFESSNYNVSENGNFNNEGEVEITATATGKEPGFYSPGTFTQSAGSLKVDGQIVQSQFDIQGGIVTGGGVLDTTKSAVSGTNPTIFIGSSSVLAPGNGTDNEMLIIGDLELEGELIIELTGGGPYDIGQGDLYDFLHVSADTTHNSSTGYLNLGGILTVDLLDGFTANLGDTFDIITADGGLLNDFTSDATFTIDGYTFERTMNDNTVRLSVTSTVPVPPAIILFVTGLGILTTIRRSKII